MADDRPAGPPPELTDEQVEFLHSMLDLARAGKTGELLGFVDQGVPVNLTNAHGDSLLILAAYNGHAELVRGLLERRADPDRVNDRGQTALGCAVFRQNHAITEELLAAGADPRKGEQNAYAVTEMFGLDAMRALLAQRPGTA